MDKLNQSKTKRPMWMTLAMAATAASALVLAGCGDDDAPETPADPPAQSEQGMTNDAPAMEPAPAEEPAAPANATTGDPGLDQSTQEPMQEPAQEPMDAGAAGDEDSSFGTGTDPMPGEDTSNDDAAMSDDGATEDDMTNQDEEQQTQ